VDVAGGELEAAVLDREGVRAPGERNYIEVLVEGQLREKAPGGAIGPEHCELHRLFLSISVGVNYLCGSITERGTQAYKGKDSATIRFVTAPLPPLHVRNLGVARDIGLAWGFFVPGW
jgi:hypothetical protein